jgi:hypothetical protein
VSDGVCSQLIGIPFFNKLVNLVEELHSELMLLWVGILFAKLGNVRLELHFHQFSIFRFSLINVGLWIFPRLENTPVDKCIC